MLYIQMNIQLNQKHINQIRHSKKIKMWEMIIWCFTNTQIQTLKITIIIIMNKLVNRSVQVDFIH